MDVILVIADRPERAKALSERLGVSGVEAIPCARDWKLAIRCLTSHKVSLVLLSVDSSPESEEFFVFIKDLISVPIAALGSVRRSEDAIWYLENGAVDYIPAKTEVGVLAAKILLQLRSAGTPLTAQATRLEVGDLEIDLDAYAVQKSGQYVSLTPIEFKLLRVLAENVGAACSQPMLLEAVWGDGFQDCAHYLRLYMGYLRQKLEVDPGRPKLLLTERGYGYRLANPRPAASRPAQARAPLRNAAFG